MLLDRTTLRLFGEFPREVGNPSREIARNRLDLENFIAKNNGLRDCFVGVYPLSGCVDKIPYDSDGIGALYETKVFLKYLLSQNYVAIPVVSGKKGYHIHVLLKSKNYGENTKELLFNATMKLLEDAFGVNSKNELKCISFDSHTFGDIRQLIRIPNTLRPPENRNYCTYLPPNEFLDMTESDVALHMKAIHTYRPKNGNNLLTLEDFGKTKVRNKPYNQVESNILGNTGSHKLLRGVLRPCLFRHITSPNPRHDVRVATTIDLLNFFSPSDILKKYSELNWADFDPKITEYQIETCKKLRSYGCATLMKKGIPKSHCEECIG